MSVDFNKILAGIFQKGVEASGESAISTTKTGAEVAGKTAKAAFDPNAAMNVNPMNVGSSLVQNVSQAMSGGEKPKEQSEDYSSLSPAGQAAAPMDKAINQILGNPNSTIYQNMTAEQLVGLKHQTAGILQQEKQNETYDIGGDKITLPGQDQPSGETFKDVAGKKQLVTDTSSKAITGEDPEDYQTEKAMKFSKEGHQGKMGHVLGFLGQVAGINTPQWEEDMRYHGERGAAAGKIGYETAAQGIKGQLPLSTEQRALMSLDASAKQLSALDMSMRSSQEAISQITQHPIWNQVIGGQKAADLNQRIKNSRTDFNNAINELAAAARDYKKNPRTSDVGKGKAAEIKGKIHIDANGNRAIKMPNGSWKEI
jgi:hypothetical protein